MDKRYHSGVEVEPGRADTRRLAAASLARGDATGWFERLYAEAGEGRAEVPWDRPEPSANLLSAGLPPGSGLRALVVGCGTGRDAEYVAGLGPPWPLTRDEVDLFAVDGPAAAGVEELTGPDGPFVRRWRAVFRR